MHAWAIRHYGDPPSLFDMPDPAIRGPDDILIRMEGVEIGVWDELIRLGDWPMDRPFPLVLGLAGAGRVVSCGENVSKFGVGDAVFAYGYPLYDNGAWAQYMLVPQAYVAPAPGRLPLEYAGAVPIVGLTAHETINDILNVSEGEIVLITAASGGVGHLAVQLAAARGARVVATTGPRDLDFVIGLGAETVIDYTKGNVAGPILKRYPAGVEKALNCVSGSAANEIMPAMRPGGYVLDLTGDMAGDHPDVQVKNDYAVQGDGARLREVAALIETENLTVTISEDFEFAHAPQALARVLARHVRGKIALAVS